MEQSDIISLPYDIAVDILLRLPLETIFQIKRVSKEWNKFMSQPSFQKQYRDSNRKHVTFVSGLFYWPGFSEGAHVYITFSSDREGIIQDKSFGYLDNVLKSVIASSNRLLLLRSNLKKYYVCDPCFKIQVELPQTSTPYKNEAVGFYCEVNDRDDEFYVQYKLVLVEADVMRKTHTVEIYSSETGKWKKSLVTASSEFRFTSWIVAKVIKGVFIWEDWGNNTFVVYDPKNPKGRVELIECLWREWGGIYDHYRICEARDSMMKLIAFRHNGVEVWVFDETNSAKECCWTLIETFSWTDVGFQAGYQPVRIYDSSFDDNQHNFLHNTDGDIVVFDWRTRSVLKRVAASKSNVPPIGPIHIHYQPPIWPLLL